MIDLDNLSEIKQLDKENLYGSVDQLPKQCQHAWDEANKIFVPDSYRQINKIVMCGMGGSGLAARIIESVYAKKLKYPLARINDYDLPSWVDDNTLVIISAYSGFTEEPIECAYQAIKKKLKWMAIGAGGLLIDLAKKHNVPYYLINPIYNPSKQPRMAIGYSLIGQLAMVSKVDVVDITDQDILSLAKKMDEVRKETNVNVLTGKNPAKKIAKLSYGKKVVFVTSRHLLGAAHTIKNQMNENAKNFAMIFDIPELNHHLMEGLRFPESNQKDLLFLFVNSNLYPSRIQQRFAITQNIVKENKVRCLVWQAKSTSLLSQSFEFIQFGGYVNFYLAMLNGINPSPIPYVDKFKTELGQPLGQWR